MDPYDFTVNVPADHPAFAGHFPGHPVLPGVVLLAEVLAGVERGLGVPMDRIVIRVAKFHAPVAPGDALAVRLEHGHGITFSIARDGTRVASGTIALTDAPAQEGAGHGRAGAGVGQAGAGGGEADPGGIQPGAGGGQS